MNIPQIKTKFGINIGATVFVKNPDLSEYQSTYLSTDETAGQTTLDVISTSGLSDNDYVLIGAWGDETAELRRITVASTTTLTVTATTFSHSRGTKLTFIPYNQVVVSRSTDSGATYVALSATDILPSNDWTIIQRTADAATDMYKVRFYNSTTALYSSYSDAVVASGFADNSVYSIKKRALQQIGETINDKITDEFLNECLWEARREVENDPTVIKFPFRKKVNYAFSQVIPGTFKVALPTDLKEPYSNKNISKIRVGKDSYITYYQPTNEFWNNYYNKPYTTLNGNVSDTDVTITLTNSGDFEDSGAIYIAAPSISGTIDTIDYTANDKVTNTLSGVTNIATGGHTSGALVWQNIEFGTPISYTVEYENGTPYVLFNIPFSDDLAGNNIYIDYYYTLPVYNSDNDVLDEPEYDMYVDYLKWKIKSRQKGGALSPAQDPDFNTWQLKKQNFINKLHSGDVVYLYPKI